MQHDLPLRAAARAIYENVYPTEDWAPIGFDEAERFGTVHYRQAVGAAQEARSVLADRSHQLLFTAFLQLMTLQKGERPINPVFPRPAEALSLHEIPFELVPREVPFFLCHTPACFPSPAQDDMEQPIDLASWLIDHPAASYVMRVAGRSMVEAGITDGDLVVVSRAVEARSGDIVVALVHGDRTMKRLRRSGDRLWLVPEATGFDRILVDESVEIWGVVVALARRYRA